MKPDKTPPHIKLDQLAGLDWEIIDLDSKQSPRRKPSPERHRGGYAD